MSKLIKKVLIAFTFISLLGFVTIFSILWSCAQHEVLKKQFKVHATLLVDDIKSELDDRVFNLFLNLLNHVDTQIIFSCIDDCFSSKITSSFNNFKKFHVEHLRQL